MEKEIRQLVEMGATQAQARAALKQYKDVMEAAEKFFEGQFDDIADDGDVQMNDVGNTQPPSRPNHLKRPATPDDDDEDEEDPMEDEGSDDDGFLDYDSDFGTTTDEPTRKKTDVDPYAGIFYSKDRREEVIEVEEDMEMSEVIPEVKERTKLMTQGQWMKGCPEGGEQSFLFGLYSELSEGACPCPQGCKFSVTRKKSDFFPLFSQFSTYIERLAKLVSKTCPECHSNFCFACGESVSADRVKRPSAAEDDPLFHCPNLQGVILGVGLSMIEQLFAEQSQEASEEKESTRTTKRRKTTSPNSRDFDDEDDVYYAGAAGPGKKKGGIGYAGNQKEDDSGILEAIATQQAKDAKIGNLLTSVRVYLPNLNRTGGGQSSDYLVHPTALAHLRRRFNYVCSALLRNDSLADMSDRSVLYFELLAWLETISNHEALASMMAMPIMTVVSVKAVVSKKTKSNSYVRERTIVYEGSPSPRELLEGIAIQAQAALKGLESIKPFEVDQLDPTEEENRKRQTVDLKGKSKDTAEEISDENQKLVQFCRRILATTGAIDRSLRDNKGDAFVDRLHASLPKIFTTTSHGIPVEAPTNEEHAKKLYVQWATHARFKYCDLTLPTTDGADQQPHFKFYYNNEARMLANSYIPKRSLAIAKELAILTTNLPVAYDSSVFLRVDETRVDVIKALITGPEGTPYHNGCYLFDIFLGPSYNQAPPSVKYMTTNGGKFRFNPNLYADGKVCLSLLGTWSGPGWSPGKSTLLQVLISIQSMILCEEPYLNEPGWAASAGTPASHAYSANVRRMVVKTAMLGNLRNPPEPFADVIRTHFRLKAKSIATQLDIWLSKDDGKATCGEGAAYNGGRGTDAGSSSNGFKADIEEMKVILKQLEAGKFPGESDA
ncbi:hypothetical protein C8J56DRAFT_934652 [Mycena floridula]|nr:hypothetical protein C8J56DRAFT_934652 [Mycena floridula]